MAVMLIFAAITLPAVLFLLRFLIAICGQEGRAPHVVHLAQVAPERDDPAGGQEDHDDSVLSLVRGTCAHRRIVPMHAHCGGHWPKEPWTETGTGRTRRSRG